MTNTQASRHIYLHASIDTDQSARIYSELNAIDIADASTPIEEREPVSLHIASYGGNLEHTFAIISKIEEMTTPVIAHIDAKTCSAAALLAISCKTRIMHPRATLLIHSSSDYYDGYMNIFKQRQTLLETKRHNDMMVELIAAHSHLSEAELHDIMESGRDHTYSAQEALSCGLVDSIKPV